MRPHGHDCGCDCTDSGHLQQHWGMPADQGHDLITVALEILIQLEHASGMADSVGSGNGQAEVFVAPLPRSNGPDLCQRQCFCGRRGRGRGCAARRSTR